MKILLSGGGTGGHITPILAVAHELKALNSECQTVYVGEGGGKFTELMAGNRDIDQVLTISAGKFRRYYGESWLRRLVDIRTNVLNIRDAFRTLVGVWQAWRLLGRVKPDLVFLKGGFVGVPVGIAAAVKHIPIVTHDSDAVPGLANRLIGRWAKVHATALPATLYDYPTDKVVQVGVLVGHMYEPVDTTAQKSFKNQIGIPEDKTMLLVTGGSSGAQRLNEAVRRGIEALLEYMPDLYVVHQVGKGKTAVYDGFSHDRLQVFEFLNPMYVYMGAADLVVTRASGNTLAELGVQGKPVIAVPSPFLTGGHQLKNAERLVEQGAASVVNEGELYDSQHGLLATIQRLLADPRQRAELAGKLQRNTITDAARRLAVVLLDQITKTEIRNTK